MPGPVVTVLWLTSSSLFAGAFVSWGYAPSAVPERTRQFHTRARILVAIATPLFITGWVLAILG
jgi:hypothetical protein